MTVHALATLTITSPEILAQYREKAATALSRHGGAVLQASATLDLLEGGPDLPGMAAVLTFPDRQAALAWINDPELAPVHALRRGSGHSTIILL
ncbi:MAG: DUF1330 domain-containing protein [Hoeflea sp.]|nr:DUF1330 domain-containing protein [Hoeflea sp.]